MSPRSLLHGSARCAVHSRSLMDYSTRRIRGSCTAKCWHWPDASPRIAGRVCRPARCATTPAGKRSIATAGHGSGRAMRFPESTQRRCCGSPVNRKQRANSPERCAPLPETSTDMATHWREATLGEAALLLGEADVAAAHYRAAVAAARHAVGHIASMRRQVRLLSASMNIAEAVQAALEVPRVVVFTGHMLDAPGRSSPRFPAALETAVANEIAARVAAMGAGFGYCSAACGSDYAVHRSVAGTQSRGAHHAAV